ncbi:nucleotidyltransferase [Methylobacterium mesophilicum SR1.6/6]|uniref:Nucleotidyltransferase n=1 Tax=Methylobacterium mesophilicum SR1.6/6 TaxID=908290 RepID=A0A6B9FMJ7_9HYPH|nr:nucleotidyltransferase [Methylobacterium mesophilicum]QGY03627.1 nucleotidyltransferase [Methylobacterium mesophilicum SR1.6/6]
MSADTYLQNILIREAVDIGLYSPVRSLRGALTPILQEWGGQYLMGIAPSGSFAKGTANRSGTDIDLFLSLAQSTPHTLKEIYEKLFAHMERAGFNPKRQNVSIGIRANIAGVSYDVDLVPGRRQDWISQDHSLFRRRADTWTKTNVDKHIQHVSASYRTQEMRVLKLWRNQKQLDFTSFYLEMTVIAALYGAPYTTLANNVWKVFGYLTTKFESARVIDPANTNNILSDELSAEEKRKIKMAAGRALAASDWNQIVT